MDLAEKKSEIGGWKAHSWERVNGGSIIYGEGKDGEMRMKVVVSNSEMQEYGLAFEARTGKCFDCKGEGKVIASWHHETGTEYKQCPRCSGDSTSR